MSLISDCGANNHTYLWPAGEAGMFICPDLSQSYYYLFNSYGCWEKNWSNIRRRQWHPTPVLLPGKSHGWRRLVGCSPQGPEELDTTERLHFHFSLSCTGERNGNPLQCSCLENPRNGRAWWAAIYEVAQSRTWLKQLSSSSSKVRWGPE